MSEVEGLIEAQTREQYRAARQDAVFPSTQSLEWFIRRNRVELIEAGALICPTGRWLIVAKPFDRVVKRVGNERAKRFLRGHIGGHAE